MSRPGESLPSNDPRAASPHGGIPLRIEGAPLASAKAAVLLAHGRGATAEGMLQLARAFAGPDVALLAPQAHGGSWYPNSFLAPLPSNEPGLSSGIERLEEATRTIAAQGIAAERLLLVGFSQGACLISEMMARRPRRFGGVALLTGGFAGPPGTSRSPAPPGSSLSGTPVLLSSGDPDPHVPFARVQETAELFGRLGGEIDLRRYPGRPHTVVEEEIQLVAALLDRLLRSASS